MINIKLAAECTIECPQSDRGGQHVTRMSSTVRVTHNDTGLVAEVTARSQHRSTKIALAMIEWGLLHRKEMG